MRKLISLFRDEKGATAIEYGLIAGLIAVVIIGTMVALGGKLEGVFGEIHKELNEHVATDEG